MIRCGWCNAETNPDRCGTCGRDPALPWLQRGAMPPEVSEADRFRAVLSGAEEAIRADGLEPTIDRLADKLDVSPRTVRRWRAVAS